LLSSLALIYASMQVILFSNLVIHKNMFFKVEPISLKIRFVSSEDTLNIHCKDKMPKI